MAPITSRQGYMRAAQFNTITKKITVNEIPIPECTDNEILIKNVCASLCHSDLMLFWDGTKEEATSENVTVGHENTGIVVEVGKNVKGFSVGDKVGCLGCSYACYTCEGCNVHNLLCLEGTGRMHGFSTAGHFADYSVSDYRNAMVLPEGIDMVSAAPLFCAGVTAYHAVSQCELAKGEWVAVIGCGGLGHLGIQYAKAMGYKVAAVDISDAQLENARSLGADLVCNSMTDPVYVQKIKSATKGGCHAAIIFSAALVAYDNAPKVLRVNGLMMIVGIPPKNLSISALDVLLGRFRVKGASTGTPKTMKDPIYFSHKHNIKPHLTIFDDLEDIHEIVRLMEEGKTAGRCAVTFR
ncbi:chaperonin 10-like protein [Leptodontidium sp. MPI-SDFR-AT-0119]|nr:chaperonin 10-like protein [Leptodontidium sp. MPI-SDFR-AT-0119]